MTRKNMPPENIQAMLTVRNVTQAGIAREKNVSDNAVHLAIYGKLKSADLHDHIANNLHLTKEIIWPELYAEQPIDRRKTRALSKGFIK